MSTTTATEHKAAPAGTSLAGSRMPAWLRQAGPIVLLVLGVKALVFVYGLTLVQVMENRNFTGLTDRFSLWFRWDAPHYLSLAEFGYQSVGQPADYIVFFPGYPLAVRIVDLITPGSLLFAGFLAAGIASVSAALLLAALVRHDTGGDQAQATRAVWFLLVFPTAYFLHLPYTEGLFLTFVLGSFLAARKGHWALAGIIGALAALTRLNGVILIPALAVEAYLQYRRTGKFDRSWLWIGFVAAGVVVYLGINQVVFGDPTHFQDVQRDVWFKSFQDPVTSVTSMVSFLDGASPLDWQMRMHELLFLGIGLAAALLAFVFSRPSYAVWALLNVVLFASTSWIQSTPRYVITLFPIFLMLAAIDRRVWLSKLAAGWSLAMMMYFTALFALGKWAF